MSAGPRISSAVRRLITERALQDRKKPREDVAIELEHEIADKGYRVPEHETLLKYITKDRNHPPRPEDEPWTFSSNYPVPPEALLTVLKIRKLRALHGSAPGPRERYGDIPIRPLTIREVKWVTRLHTAISDLDRLDSWATKYATREQVCETVNAQFEARDLDVALMMGPWEWETAHWMGRVQTYRPDDLHYLTSDSDTSLAAFQVAIGFPGKEAIEGSETDALWPIVTAAAGFRDELMKSSELWEEHFQKTWSMETMYKKLPDPSDLIDADISEDARWVYVRWLLYLANGPKWKALSVDQAVGIIQRLRQWILTHPWAQGKGAFPIHFFRHVQDKVTELPEFKPSELLREMGYELDAQETSNKASQKGGRQ